MKVNSFTYNNKLVKYIEKYYDEIILWRIVKQLEKEKVVGNNEQ